MSNRRAAIAMDATETLAFLQEERTVSCATVGRDGWPHLVPLWYVVREAGDGGPELWAWTYAASQKVRNLERDPRATLQVQAGESYELLRGVMLECETVLHRDLATVTALGIEIFTRYAAPRGAAPATELPDAVRAVVEHQAGKRVGLQFVERSRASWDHRKLGGVY